MADDVEENICAEYGHVWVDCERGQYCNVCGVEEGADQFERTVEFVDIDGRGEKLGTFHAYDDVGHAPPGHQSRRRRMQTGTFFE
jgi:hypothetical protein